LLLNVKNLTVNHGEVLAIKGISLSVEPATIVALLGANGAGKTTTLRAISGLAKPASGEIWFGGRRVDGLSAQRLVRMGLGHVPEGRRVFPDMSVFENLLMGAYLRHDRLGISRDIEAVYSHFPILKERKNQRTGSLSGGEQQMLAIGRALMSNPKLLLLDEPSLGLSPLFTQEIGAIITGINKERQVGILLVEQNARLALKLAHKGYVLETGNIMAEGSSEQLRGSEYVKKAYLGS